MIVLTAYCGSNAQKKAEKDADMQGTMVMIDSVAVKSGDSLDVPVRLNNTEAVAGMQMRIQFDQKMISVGKPKLTSRSTDMLVMHNVKESELLVMMYNLSGKSIAPGKGSVLTIPVTVARGASGSCTLDLKEAILARQDAQTIPSARKSGMVVVRNR